MTPKAKDDLTTILTDAVHALRVHQRDLALAKMLEALGYIEYAPSN